MRTDGELAAAAGNGHGVRDRMIVRDCEIGRRQHRDHARGFFGGRCIDAVNRREGVWRTYEICGQRALRFHVIAKPSLPAQKWIILDASRPGMVTVASYG